MEQIKNSIDFEDSNKPMFRSLDQDKKQDDLNIFYPYSKITCLILYIYSMETFVYHDLNRVCREKDTNQIQYFGAYAAALSYIIHAANNNRKEDKLTGKTLLYRGLKLPINKAKNLKEG